MRISDRTVITVILRRETFMKPRRDTDQNELLTWSRFWAPFGRRGGGAWIIGAYGPGGERTAWMFWEIEINVLLQIGVLHPYGSNEIMVW